jgi:hypothetical protein
MPEMQLENPQSQQQQQQQPVLFKNVEGGNLSLPFQQ